MNTNRSIPLATRATLVFALALAFACSGTLRAGGVSETAAANLNGGMPEDWAQCDVPERRSIPAAGHWKGSYRLVIEMRHPPIVMHIKTEGSLEFDLARYEAPETVHYPPLSGPLRKPLAQNRLCGTVSISITPRQ